MKATRQKKYIKMSRVPEKFRTSAAPFTPGNGTLRASISQESFFQVVELQGSSSPQQNESDKAEKLIK
jgi:hypothetical protein